MEKKKVKAMIEDAISRLAILHADEGDSYEHIIKILENALEELSKPDWISVKDKLPPYEKSVLVCNENDPATFCELLAFYEEVKRYYDEVKKIATRLGMSD